MHLAAGFRAVVLALGSLGAVAIAACKPTVAHNSVGPAGGVVTSDDDVLTLVLWPGALGSWEDFEVTATEDAPESYGQAYAVSPNPTLGIDVEVILRGELPETSKLARVGVITDGAEAWRTLPLEAGAINGADDTVRGHHGEIAQVYAMLDVGDIDGGTTGEPGTTGDSTETGDPTNVPVSFAADVQPIFDANCINPASCHGVMPSGSLSLDTDAYANLVGVQAHIDGSLTRVIAGDPDNSLLMNKIDYEPPPTGGIPMPTGGMMPEETRGIVRAWIEQGCPP